MAIVALDTSTLTTSLALLSGDRLPIDHRLIGPPHRQSDILPNEIAAMIDRHGVAFSSIDLFVIGLGPGSFTGLRIGLATMKGLAYALKRPLVGVSSLAAIALEAEKDVSLQVIAVVKRGELYVGSYRRDGESITILAPEKSLTVSQLADTLIADPKLRVVGSALVEYRQSLLDLGVSPSCLADNAATPSAIALARLAPRVTEFVAEDLFQLEPHYLRGSGAEENPKFPPLPGIEAKARLKTDDA